ncbi:hypothetical protein ACFVJS_02995 [Nocardioides sp. NPDC057772]|uniref:hypothetical protein n=1 Tax=Nocardioides sp. NPDC057772 TaxID=3346245 RepID=UPI00367336A8
MYDPANPDSSDIINGGPTGGRIINYGAIFIIFGGGGASAFATARTPRVEATGLRTPAT